MFILGQPKSLSELKPVSKDEINSLASFLDDQIKQGTPLEIPQAMPLADLGRLIRTVQELQLQLEAKEEDSRPKLFIPPVDGQLNE